jgi:predicted nucleic acid-binding protein
VRDPDDDYLIELARTAHADALVSIDRDLLDASIDDIAIRTPTAFLRQLASV